MSDFILGPLGEFLIRLIQDLSNPILDLYFGVVTTLGETLPIIVVLVLLYYTLNKDFMSKVIYLVILSNLLNHITKIFFHNPRPYLYDSEFQVTTDVLGKQTTWGAEGYSFPSGHSQTQGTIWGYLFPKISSDMSSMEFAKTWLEEASVAITPGIAFGPSCDDYVRFSYATSRQRIKDGFARIDEAIKKGKL